MTESIEEKPSQAGILAGQTYACYGQPQGSVLLLHALGSCKADWVFQVPVLRETYDVITVDLPGHGESPLFPGCRRIEDMATCVEDYLKTATDGKVHVVGLSLGGAVAIALAQAYPQRVRSLLLVNAFARMHIHRNGRGRIFCRVFHLLRGDMQALAETVAGGVFPAPEQQFLKEAAVTRLAANPRNWYFHLMNAIRLVDLRAGLSTISVPCLVVSGESDTTVAESAKRELADLIPTAHWLSIPGSGHATPLDMPDVFNQHMLAFLQDASASPSPSSSLQHS